MKVVAERVCTRPLKNIIEALLIAATNPLNLEQLAAITKISKEEVKKYLDELNQEYQITNRSFEIKEIAGGYQIYTLPQYAEWVSLLHQKRERLSRAALETLAVIAYHQPITRAELEKTRGVDSTWILDSLMQKGLIKTCGRLNVPGRPIRYGTTREFLRYFGLNDLADLPKEEDFGEQAIGSKSEEATTTKPAEGVEPSPTEQVDALAHEKITEDEDLIM